jgi:hypothetical protein
MNLSAIPNLRLHNLGIRAPADLTPAGVVERLVAVQAQDYYAAQWSLGLRMQQAAEDPIEQALTDGSILRTHLLRPTWHFVTPADIGWLLALTAPHVHQINGTMYRQLGLDETTRKRSHEVLNRALEAGKQLTRTELQAELQKAGITVDSGLQLAYIVMSAELDGILCSGGRRGKQFTYARLAERAPQSTVMEREQALAELARRYFTSRGPATVYDLAKWSGLTINEARLGLETVKADFEHQEIEGQEYWFLFAQRSEDERAPRADLLSIYDEFISSYKDRSAILDGETAAKLIALDNALRFIIVVDGQVVGTWKPIRTKACVSIAAELYKHLEADERRAIDLAARRYGEFLQMPVEVQMGSS